MANTFKFGNGNWAVKDDYALAYNDENNNFKPLPFDFTRASSATRVNRQGLIETVGSGKPRIDFTDNTSGHLLLEPSRTNLATYSEDLSNGVYSKSNGTVTTNSAIAPDGTLTADTWTATGTNGQIQGLVTVSSGVQYTMSIYLKRKTGTGQVALRGVSNTSTNITITDEWQRYSVTLTSSDVYGRYGVLLSTSGDEVYVWGAQLEQGSYATSYIPTQGSGVTRVAERNSQGNLSNVLSSSGVIYTEIELGKSTTDTSSSEIRFNLSQNGSTNNWVFFGIENGDNLRTYVRASSSTSTDNTLDGVFPSAGTYKIAFRFDLNNTKIFVNGVQKYSDTSSTPPSNLNFFQQGGDAPFASDIEETLKVIETRLYNTALSDTELQQLTS